MVVIGDILHHAPVIFRPSKPNYRRSHQSVLGTASLTQGTVSLTRNTVSLSQGTVSLIRGTASPTRVTARPTRGTVSLTRDAASLAYDTARLTQGTASPTRGARQTPTGAGKRSRAPDANAKWNDAISHSFRECLEKRASLWCPSNQAFSAAGSRLMKAASHQGPVTGKLRTDEHVISPSRVSDLFVAYLQKPGHSGTVT